MRTPVVQLTAGAIFRGYRPRPTLRHAVDLIWTVDGPPAEPGERVLPNGVNEVILNLGEPHRVVHANGGSSRYARAWIAGTQRGPLDIRADGKSRLVGIRFRPGAAAPLLGVNAAELADSVVELEGQLVRAFRALRDRLLDVADEGARLDQVESALERVCASSRAADRRVRAAVHVLERHPTPLSLRALAAALGASHKHLIALFQRDVGVGPKMLGRILRFHRVVQAAAASTRWTDLAHAHGYADQAHLTNEFRALAGVTPTTYFAARTVDPNHLSTAALRAHRR